MDVKKILIEEYDYPLPDERIALHPLPQRDRCKLLVDNAKGRISHHVFSDLPLLVKPDTLIVANETKVIRARMEFVKSSGARIEIFLLEPYHPHDYVVNFASNSECSWLCLVGNKKRWKEGSLTKELTMGENHVLLDVTLDATIEDRGSIVKFSWDNPEYSFAEIIEAAGNIPIPPYLKRDSEESDTTDYQTVYSQTKGSVAAPTAGLHFTPELIDELKRYGNEFATVTLHVGAGTFQPVKSVEIGDHPMHTEWISVTRTTLIKLINALENGRDVLAVGTTSVRTLESLPYFGRLIEKGIDPKEVTQWMSYEEEFRFMDSIRSLKSILKYLSDHEMKSFEATTSIMIAPGFRWRIVNRLITNFHQPKSTLLLLVSSFLGQNGEGKERWTDIYREALEQDYRFLSYGDACLFTRGEQTVELPLSKSMVIRAATICAARHPDNPQLLDRFTSGLCEDSEYYINALKQVLSAYNKDSRETVDVYIGEGAAPLRFLVAFASSLPGVNVRITCAEGLRKRPLRPLIDSLIEMGAEIDFDENPSDWHLFIKGKRLEGGAIRVDSSFTSQYLSAFMLASPLWEKDFSIDNEESLSVSRPYFIMTREMLSNPDLKPEPDWSAAAFFYEYCLVSGKKVIISSLVPPAQSLQGDSAVCGVYDNIGVRTSFSPDGSATLEYVGGIPPENVEIDFTDHPDMAPSIAVALCYKRIPFVFSGVSHLRYKECDRLTVLQNLLVRIGYEMSIEGDKLKFNGEFRPYQELPVELDSYGDHRMAMAFYPLELKSMVKISDKDVAGKSFPDFYQQFK